jgi:DNA polymerase-3 subunit beta
MKVIVNKEEFLKSLQKIQGVVEKRTTMPILNNLLLEADEKLTIKATNLENSIIIKIDAKIDQKGKICIPAKKLYEIIKSLSENTLTITTTDKNIVIKSGKSTFKIFTQPAEDFPAIKTISHEKKITLNKNDFVNSLTKIEYAIYPDESRISLNGVYIHKEEEKLRFVASDGYRLAYNEVNHPDPCQDVLLTKKAVSEIKKICIGTTAESINIFIGDNYASFEFEDTTLITRLNDAKFPNYKDVIPNNPFKCYVNKKLFIDALKRISTVAEENTKGVILTLDKNKLLLKSSNADIGEAEDEIEISYDGESISAGFNADYVMEAINPLECEKIEMLFKDSQTAVTVSGDENYKALVMPIRI